MSGSVRDDPAFTLEHVVSIPGSAAEVWAVFSDFAAYPEWNPYVLEIVGAVVPGESPDVTIAQENWPQPLTIQPTIVSLVEQQLLHWRGQVGDGGLFDTDHSFELQPEGTDAIRFIQREEFRGSLTEQMDPEARACTEAAFRRMNEALAERVRSLRG